MKPNPLSWLNILILPVGIGSLGFSVLAELGPRRFKQATQSDGTSGFRGGPLMSL
jgi:hypothetical protein